MQAGRVAARHGSSTRSSAGSRFSVPLAAAVGLGVSRIRQLVSRHPGGALRERISVSPTAPISWRTFLLMCCFASLAWILVTTFAPTPWGLLVFDAPNSTAASRATVCPRDTVCAEEWYTLLLLGVSRSSAYFTYPLMMLLYLSKTNHLRTVLQGTFLSLYFPFHNLHDLHTAAGRAVAVDVTVHAACHIARWASQGNVSMLWTRVTGMTGFISICATPLVALPMAWPRLKKALSWEASAAAAPWTREP